MASKRLHPRRAASAACSCLFILNIAACACHAAPAGTGKPGGTQDSKVPREESFAAQFARAKAAVDAAESARKAGSSERTSPNDAWSQLDALLARARTFGSLDSRVADVQMLFGRYKPLVGNVTTEHYDEALKIRELTTGPDSLQTAAALEGLAMQQAHMSKYAEASENLSRAIEIVGKNKGKGSAELVDALDYSINRGLSRVGDPARLIRRALRMMQANLKPNDVAIPHAMSLLAVIESNTQPTYPRPANNSDTAIVAAEQAIAAQRRANSNPNDPQLAAMYEILARRQNSIGEYAEAVKTYETVVKIREASKSKEPPLMARTYDTMADYLKSANQLPAAEAYKNRSLSIWEKNPDSSKLNLINGLNSMIAFYSNDPKKQLPYYERLLPIERIRNSADISPVENLAKAYMACQKYDQAEPYLKEWLAYYDERDKQNHDYQRVVILEQLGDAQTHLYKLSEAGKNLNRAKDFYEHQKIMSRNGELLPQRFLELYIAYLKKAAKPVEVAAYTLRLETLKAKERVACAACGMG
jgi:tetratricopeptide (TPR) repeat protein